MELRTFRHHPRDGLETKQRKQSLPQNYARTLTERFIWERFEKLLKNLEVMTLGGVSVLRLRRGEKGIHKKFIQKDERKFLRYLLSLENRGEGGGD